MDTQPPSFPETPPTPTPLKTQEAPVKKDSHPVAVISVGLFVIASLATVIFLYSQNQKLKSMLAAYQSQASPTPTATADPTTDWEIFTSEDGSYSIKYPPDWGTHSLGGTLVIAPKENLEQIRGVEGFGGGPFLVVVINNVDNPTVAQDEFQKVASQKNTLLSGRNAVRYEIEILQSSPMGSPGDRLVSVITPHQESYLKIDLLDSQYEGLFDQILSTFEFLEATPSPESKACTQEAKLCPNGSYVGRTGPNCEFAPCPTP